MRELSKNEMKEVSGAGFLGDFFTDISHSADVALKSVGNAFVETAKVFTDFVFGSVKGFWEGRYTK